MLPEVLKTDVRTTGRHPYALLVRSRCLISCSVVFNQSENFYVSSRASAINFGIPDAIYRYATQQPGGPLSVFQDEYGFLNATTEIYASIFDVYDAILTSNLSRRLSISPSLPKLISSSRATRRFPRNSHTKSHVYL
jgi:hypothetical protein